MFDLILCTGDVLKYDSDEMNYHADFGWCGDTVEMVFVAPPTDQNKLNALEYAFNNLYNRQDEWNDLFLETLWNKIDSLFRNENISFDYSLVDLAEKLELGTIFIMYLSDVSFFKPEGVHIKVVYKFKAMCDLAALIGSSISLSGTLEEGFDELDTVLRPASPILPPRMLPDGNEISYSFEYEAYHGDIELSGEFVELYLELNKERTNADSSFELMEKVLAEDEKYIGLAIGFIEQYFKSNIDKLDEIIGSPSLTAGDIIDCLTLVTMVFGSSTMEFTFDTGYPVGLKISASGTLEEGFTKIVIEDETSEGSFFDDDENI